MSQIKPGKKVVLKLTGAPEMLVASVLDKDEMKEPIATCNWLDTENRPMTASYPLSSLRIVEEP